MTFATVTGCTFFVVVLSLLTSRNYRVTVALGAPTGMALGVWLVAPLWINNHYLVPETLAHWISIDAFLFVTFGLGGVALALLLCWPLALAGLTPRKDARLPALGAITILVMCLSVGFIGLGAAIEWTGFARTYQLRILLRTMEPVVVTMVPVISFLIFSWIWFRAPGSLPDRLVQWSVFGAIVLGFVVLPFRVNGAAPRVETGPLARRSAPRPAPLLVVGIDGGSWQVLRPLIESKQLPTLARLVAQGLHGEILAPWPPYWSGPAWAAIMTGHSKDAIAVHEQVSAKVGVLPTFQVPFAVDLRFNALAVIEATLVRQDLMHLEPFPRDLLKVAPIWERLQDAGARVGVIRFPFSYPAVGQAEHVISFRVVADFWNMIGVKPGDRDLLVSSSQDSERLLRWFTSGPTVDPQLFDGVLTRPNWPKPAGDRLDPSPIMGELLTTAHRTFGVTHELLRNDTNLDAVMLYVGEFDVASHALWPYRFPKDYPAGRVAEPDIAVLGPLFDRYVIDFDKHLGEIIQGFDRRPNVLIVSDHGMEASREPTIWHGWHSARGAFLAAGPDIPHDETFLSMPYADVAPTIVDLLNFDQPADLKGRSLLGGRTIAQAPPAAAGSKKPASNKAD